MRTREFAKAGLDRLHSTLSGYVERKEIPGFVSVVSRNDETHVEPFGHLGFGKSQAIRRDSIFRISSMTKPITAAAAMILVEEGRLRLDDPVDKFLPELANRKVLKRLDGPLTKTIPSRRPITLRDLLTLRMGIGIIPAEPGTYPIQRAMDQLELGQGPPSPSSVPAPDEWLRRLGTLPLVHQPGDRWMYGTGADVLGVLISRASGETFEGFLRDRIFNPLGMDDTGFSVPLGKIDRLAQCYWTKFGTAELGLYDAAVDGQWSRPPAFQSGAGGLVSTADDYLRFGQMMLKGGSLGRRRVLSRSSVALMTTDQLTPAQKEASGSVFCDFEHRGWGFGVQVVTTRDDLAASIGKFGWDGGLGTSWDSDPTESMVTILLTQRMSDSAAGSSVFQDFRTLAYGAIVS
jgi:CubicO group peptidase (beta-lactamase class C family)